MSTQPRLRGTILIDQMAQLEQAYGATVIEAALARLSPAEAAEIRGNHGMAWLAVPTVTAFKTAVAEELGMPPLELQRIVVRRAIADTIHKVWRVLLTSLWDSAVVKRTPILYSKTFDRGEMLLEHIAAGTATFVLHGWPDMPEYDCVGVATGMEALLEYTGRSGALVQWSVQPPRVVFEATWRVR